MPVKGNGRAPYCSSRATSMSNRICSTFATIHSIIAKIGTIKRKTLVLSEQLHLKLSKLLRAANIIRANENLTMDA